MVVLDAGRRNRPVPRLGTWSLGADIVTTVVANLAHGVGHGPGRRAGQRVGCLALACPFELLMMLIRPRGVEPRIDEAEPRPEYQAVPPLVQEAPPALHVAPMLEQTVRARYQAGAGLGRHRPGTQPRPP